LDAQTVVLLREHQARQILDHGEVCEYVFADWRGEPVKPSYVSHQFAAKVKASGLPPVRLHDLRHGAATLAQVRGIASDASFDVVCDRSVATGLGFRASIGSMRGAANRPGLRAVKVRCCSRPNNRSTSLVVAGATMMHLTQRRPVEGQASSYGTRNVLDDENAWTGEGPRGGSPRACRRPTRAL